MFKSLILAALLLVSSNAFAWGSKPHTWSAVEVTTSQMDDSKHYKTSLISNNNIDVRFQYTGVQISPGIFVVANSDTNAAVFAVQFLNDVLVDCSGECDIQVRLDNDAPITLKASSLGTNGIAVANVEGTKFLQSLKDHTTLKVGVPIFENGVQVVEFNIAKFPITIGDVALAANP